MQVGTAATAFATIINRGATTATGCSPAPLTGVRAGFSYQTTDPTNQHACVDCAGGGAPVRLRP